MRVSHLGICVSDLERSLAFYRDAVESELSVDGEPSETLLRLRPVKLRAVYLVRDGVRILRDTRIENEQLRAKALFATDPDGTLIELVETRPRQA